MTGMSPSSLATSMIVVCGLGGWRQYTLSGPNTTSVDEDGSAPSAAQIRLSKLTRSATGVVGGGPTGAAVVGTLAWLSLAASPFEFWLLWRAYKRRRQWLHAGESIPNVSVDAAASGDAGKIASDDNIVGGNDGLGVEKHADVDCSTGVVDPSNAVGDIADGVVDVDATDPMADPLLHTPTAGLGEDVDVENVDQVDDIVGGGCTGGTAADVSISDDDVIVSGDVGTGASITASSGSDAVDDVSVGAVDPCTSGGGGGGGGGGSGSVGGGSGSSATAGIGSQSQSVSAGAAGLKHGGLFASWGLSHLCGSTSGDIADPVVKAGPAPPQTQSVVQQCDVPLHVAVPETPAVSVVAEAPVSAVSVPSALPEAPPTQKPQERPGPPAVTAGSPSTEGPSQLHTMPAEPPVHVLHAQAPEPPPQLPLHAMAPEPPPGPPLGEPQGGQHEAPPGSASCEEPTVVPGMPVPSSPHGAGVDPPKGAVGTPPNTAATDPPSAGASGSASHDEPVGKGAAGGASELPAAIDVGTGSLVVGSSASACSNATAKVGGASTGGSVSSQTGRWGSKGAIGGSHAVNKTASGGGHAASKTANGGGRKGHQAQKRPPGRLSFTTLGAPKMGAPGFALPHVVAPESDDDDRQTVVSSASQSGRLHPVESCQSFQLGSCPGRLIYKRHGICYEFSEAVALDAMQQYKLTDPLAIVEEATNLKCARPNLDDFLVEAACKLKESISSGFL